MAIRRIKCEECGKRFSTNKPHQRFCSERCAKRAAYWRFHVEPYLLPEIPRQPKPFMFCRAGDHTKCPAELVEGSCPCECHRERKRQAA